MNVFPAGTALIVIDAQEDTFAVARVPGRFVAVARLNRLLEAARAAGVPTALLRQETRNPLLRVLGGGRFAPGSPGAELVVGLDDRDETVVVKSTADAFDSASFAAWIDRVGPRHLVVAGGLAESCVKATVAHALAARFGVTVVEDALLAASESGLARSVVAMRRSGAHVVALGDSLIDEDAATAPGAAASAAVAAETGGLSLGHG